MLNWLFHWWRSFWHSSTHLKWTFKYAQSSLNAECLLIQSHVASSTKAQSMQCSAVQVVTKVAFESMANGDSCIFYIWGTIERCWYYSHLQREPFTVIWIDYWRESCWININISCCLRNCTKAWTCLCTDVHWNKSGREDIYTVK